LLRGCLACHHRHAPFFIFFFFFTEDLPWIIAKYLIEMRASSSLSHLDGWRRVWKNIPGRPTQKPVWNNSMMLNCIGVSGVM
jgi:hypothetical protein